MAFVELRKVSKAYGGAGRRTPVLREVDLDIEEGEFVAIVGSSGVGKTTLISLIAGLIRPDGGTITLGGKEVAGPGPDRGMVFQNYSLLPWLTVRGNIALAVDELFANWPRPRRRERVATLIDMVGLAAATAKRPHELSGGMRQRVALARALAMDPRVLLLDEPLSALDALTRATLQDEIQRLRGDDRKTVVLITNDVDEAVLLADRILPLTGSAAGATLGPSIGVAIPRPRSSRTVLHDARFKAARLEVLERLLASRGSAARQAARRAPAVHLPGPGPADVSLRPPVSWFPGMGGRRKTERLREREQVEAAS